MINKKRQLIAELPLCFVSIAEKPLRPSGTSPKNSGGVADATSSYYSLPFPVFCFLYSGLRLRCRAAEMDREAFHTFLVFYLAVHGFKLGKIIAECFHQTLGMLRCKQYA